MTYAAWRPFVAALFVAVAPPVAAAGVYLEELTSPEVRDRIRAGTTTIIIPIGGTEQNGPHIALGKHNVRARLLAGKIASELGNALVAPVIAYVPEGELDPPSGHMRYAGTITVPAATYRSVVEYAARSLRAHGFRDVVLLGDSGDYQKDNEAVARRLNAAWAATKVRVHALPEYYAAATAGYRDALKLRGFHEQEIGTHAGLADTALTLAVEPTLVRLDQIDLAANTRSLPGVSGDPRKATAALGRVGVETIVARSAAAIREATTASR